MITAQKTATAQQPRTFSGLTTDPDTAIREATKVKEEQYAAGLKAMEEACKGDVIPKTLLEAAKVVARLRFERDEARTSARINQDKLRETETRFEGHAVAIVNQVPLPDGSLFANVERKFALLIKERDAALAELTAARQAIRDTFTDMGLAEVPGIANYFAGATPMLRAAEAAGVFIHGNDAQKVQYLRNRGWIMPSLGSWRDPTNKVTFPFASAVMVQVKRDALPFKTPISFNVEPKQASAMEQQVAEIHGLLTRMEEAAPTPREEDLILPEDAAAVFTQPVETTPEN